jgi:hypothetical protein
MSDWRVEANFANMEYVDFYRPLPSGRGFEVVQTGRSRPVASRDVIHPHFVFALPLPLQADERFRKIRFVSQSGSKTKTSRSE